MVRDRCAFCHNSHAIPWTTKTGWNCSLSKPDQKVTVRRGSVGFPINVYTDSPELLNSKRFLMHAAYRVEMLNTALDMLEPDVELLMEIMLKLGAKDIRDDVKLEMFPEMRKSLLIVFDATLGNAFTDEIREAWVETYKDLSGDMIRGQVQSCR